MSSVDSILVRLQADLASSRVRVKDFFADYDPLHSGSVTHNQFIRVLDICKIRLSPSEQAALLDCYVVEGVTDKVRYLDFVDHIEGVKHLEKTPTLPVQDALLPSGSHVAYGVHLTEKDRDRLSQLITRCAKEVRTRRVIVDAFFKDFDKRNSGFVTETQFRREVQSCFHSSPLSAEDIELLVKGYSHEVGARGGGGKPLLDINYRAFHHDVTYEGKDGKSAAISGLRLARRNERWGHEAEKILDSITRQVNERRLRLKDFFRDFDSLRTGFVTAEVFRRALQFANLKAVSDEDVSVIIKLYQQPQDGGKVAYNEFIKAVDFSATLNGLVKNPKSKLEGHALDVTNMPRRMNGKLSVSEENNLEYVIKTIKEMIKQKRILLLEKFVDFDRQHEESVSCNQFDRVLSEFSLLPRRAYDIDLLHRKFATIASNTGGIGAIFTGTFGPRIDYKCFLESVKDDDGEEKKETIEEPLTVFPASQKNRDASPAFSLSRVSLDDTGAAEELIAITKRKLIEQRIRIREYLSDSDKLRHGCMTVSQFHRALDIAGLGFSKGEVLVLADKYAHGNMKDHEGMPYVKWSTFADDVDSVFVVKNLEKQPTEDVAGLISKAMSNTAITHEARLSDSDLAIIKAALSDINTLVTKRRIEITPAFDDFDWHGRGVIPSSQFKRALSSLRIADNLPSSTIDIICKAFAVPAIDHRWDVNYKWFVAAVEGNADMVITALPGKGEPLKNLSEVVGADEGKISASEAAFVKRRKNTPSPMKDVNVDDLLLRMRELVMLKNVRVAMFMEDFDKLRTGNMPLAKFRTALSAAGFSLSEEEYNALERHFRSGPTSDRIEWRSLAAFLDSGGERLERNPRKNVTHSHRAVEEGYNKIPEEQINTILMKCRAQIRSSNALPKPYFKARDINHQGVVTVSQFRSVLDFLHLNKGLKEEELKMLLAAFASSKPGNTGKVDYVKFCRAIDIQ